MRFQVHSSRRFAVATAGLLLVATGTVTAQQPSAAIPTSDRFVLPATDERVAGEGPIRRYDWFQNRWRQRREIFADRAAEDRGAVVFLGDSITQGWGEDFRAAFGGMKVANRGIGGDTTRGMLLRLEEDVLQLDPAAVVMLMGTNDLEEHARPATIAGNMERIIRAIKRHDADVPIIVCQVFPSSEQKDRPKEAIQEINRLVAKAVKGDSQVILVDTWTLFAGPDGNANPEDFRDLLHLNLRGYGKWAAALRPIFATLGFLETERDKFKIEPGYESLFNGHDLTGWGYRKSPDKMAQIRERLRKRDPENAPAVPIVTKAVSFDGLRSTPDGRYVARNGRLIVTTPPEGRKIQQLWTTREFSGDFRLILEFRATPNADSGVFLFEPQLQCRDYTLAGPYKDLKNYRPQQWNELVIEARDGVARCTCNGEVIEEAFEIPPRGPIGLEGDRGQMEYRRIRISWDPGGQD
jgi:lysophospholipase L1-like esterase